MDIVDRNTRSRMMAGIKGAHTRPEMRVRQFLHRQGLRFRLHDSTLPGRPDLVLKKHGAVVNVHGCFWHRHQGCEFAYMPKSNTRFWKAKLTGNATRDVRNERALRAMGWRVFTVWECESLDQRRLASLARKIARVSR